MPVPNAAIQGYPPPRCLPSLQALPKSLAPWRNGSSADANTTCNRPHSGNAHQTPPDPDLPQQRTPFSLSWLQRAEAAGEDGDVAFICLWIAFNAAYA